MTDTCISGELTFVDGKNHDDAAANDAAAAAAGAKLRAAGFGFKIVARQNPDEPAAFAEVWCNRPNVIDDDDALDAFSLAVQQTVGIGFTEGGWSLDCVGVVSGDELPAA
jgi:hypothetical protein